MKFTLALLAATAAALLDPTNPFKDLKDTEYEQLITVNPKIAPGTARPDCNAGKCHLNHAAGADKTFLALVYNKEVDGAYSKGAVTEELLQNLEVTSPTALTLYGYAGFNLIVTHGGTANLLALVQGFPDNKLILTLHYADYKKLAEEATAAGFSLKDKAHRLFVFTIATDHTAAPTAEEQTITWIVKNNVEGQALFQKTHAANIVTLEESDYAINDFANELAFCPSKQ